MYIKSNYKSLTNKSLNIITSKKKNNISKYSTSNRLAYFSYLTELGKKILKEKQIPPLNQVRQGLGKSILNVAKNPLTLPRAAISGLSLDHAANALAKSRGYNRMGLTGRAIVKSNKPLTEAAVNTVGFLGSNIGQAPLLGDWAGSYLARRSIIDSGSLGRSIVQSRKVNPNLNPIDRTRDVFNKTVMRIKRNYRKENNPHLGDTLGWGIGNSVAAAPVGIPLKGAMAAMGTSDIVEGGIKGVQKGRTINQAVGEATQRLKDRFNVRKQIRDGFNREEAYRQKLNKRLGEVKEDVYSKTKQAAKDKLMNEAERRTMNKFQEMALRRLLND